MDLRKCQVNNVRNGWQSLSVCGGLLQLGWSFVAPILVVGLCVCAIVSCSGQVELAALYGAKNENDSIVLGAGRGVVGCYAREIEIAPVKYVDHAVQNAKSYNNFTRNFNFVLQDGLNMLKRNARNCRGDSAVGGSGSASSIPIDGENLLKYTVYIQYEMQTNIAEIGFDTYAHSSNVVFNVHYDIVNKERFVVSHRDMVTTKNIVRPQSGFAYMLSLEDAEMSASSFMAQTVLLQIINDISRMYDYHAQ